jgi:hypothetical protein
MVGAEGFVVVYFQVEFGGRGGGGLRFCYVLLFSGSGFGKYWWDQFGGLEIIIFETIILDLYCSFGRMTMELLLSAFTITALLLLSFDWMDFMVWASERAITL